MIQNYMAGGDGLDALSAIKTENPQISVVMLTTYDNPTYVARAVAGGASGYLLKGIGGDELLAALRAIADGGMLLSREDLTRALRRVGENAVDSQDLVQPLSSRELDVLGLLSTDLSNKEIAPLLFISQSTVKRTSNTSFKKWAFPTACRPQYGPRVTAWRVTLPTLRSCRRIRFTRQQQFLVVDAGAWKTFESSKFFW